MHYNNNKNVCLCLDSHYCACLNEYVHVYLSVTEHGLILSDSSWGFFLSESLSTTVCTANAARGLQGRLAGWSAVTRAPLRLCALCS